jgi:hypothetical protein
MTSTQKSAAAPRATTIITRANKGAPLTWNEHDANHVNAANTADSALTNAATAQGAANAAQSTATAAAPGGKLVTYTGTGRPLAATDNGNVVRCTNAASVTMTMPAGLPAGFSCVLVQGAGGAVTLAASAGVTLVGVPALVTAGVESDLTVFPAALDTYTVYSPSTAAPPTGGATTLAELTDIHTYDLPTNNAPLAAALSAAGASGTTFIAARLTGTRGAGNTLTAQMTDANWGWDPQFIWQKKVSGTWTTIAGATSVTYVEQSADAANDIRCLVQPVHYMTNVLIAPGGTHFTAFTETWQTQGNGQPVNPAIWTSIRPGAKEFSAGGNGWLDPTSNAVIVKNAGGSDGVIEFPRADNGGAGGFCGPGWPFLIWRSDGTQANCSYMQVNGGDRLLHAFETIGGVDSTGIVGTTLFPTDFAARYGLRVTLAGANMHVEVDTGSGYVTELTLTASAGFSNHWVGIGFSAGSDSPCIGPMHLT